MAPKRAASLGGARQLGPSKLERDRMREQAKRRDMHSLVEKRGALELNLYDTGANYQMLHIFHRRNLHRLLRELLLVHQWEAAAGVVAVLLTAHPGVGEREQGNSCRELKYLPEYRALLELVLRCQSALALSFDHCVRLYRKLLARLEVRPTGFGAGKDSAPGHGPLQMELAAFLMHRGEVERAYDAVKPLLLSSLHKHVPIYHVYAGLLQHALWLNSVEADARRVHPDAHSAAGASVRTQEHLRLATGHFDTAEDLEPGSPLIFDLRRQLEAAATKLGPAGGAPGLVERLSWGEMIQKLTSLCEKTHDVECYESLRVLLEAEDTVDPAALQRCCLQMLKVDPGAESGLKSLRTLYGKGHVSVTVHMAALANFLEAEPGHITAWGDLLDCIKRWWVAAKEGVSRASTTVNGSVASDFADVWLWRLDSWREQQFGRDILRQEWARFLRSLDSENRGPAGDGAGPERRSSEETERGATSPVGVTNAGAEVGALAEKDWRNGGVENLLLEGRDQGNELATWLRTKAAVSAYLYGPQNEYAESVLRLFRQEDSKRFDGEKLARELEASFKEAEACVKVLGSERERRDERFWAAARERESATRAKEKHKKDLLASLIKSAEATGVQSRLPTKSEVSSGHLQLMGSSEGIGLEAGSGAGLGVSRGSRGRRSQDTQAPPKGLTNPGLSKGLVVAENAVTAARTVDAAPVSGSAAGLGGISEWLRTMYPRGEVAKSLEEDQGVEPSVPRQTVGLGGNGELASLAEDEATGIVAVDDTKAGGKVREGDESVFGVLEISDEWLAEVEEERRPSGTTGERSGGPAGTGGSGGRGKGDDTSDESVSERSDESDDESDEEDDDVSRKPPRKRGGKTLSGGRKRGGATRNSKRGAAAISTESGEESGEKSDDVSDGESEDVSSEETSEGSREVTRRGRKDSSSDESDDVSSGESGDVSEDGHEEGKGTQIERLTARQQALKRKREEREPVTD